MIVCGLFEAYYNNPKLLHSGTLRKIYIETRKYTNEVIDFLNGDRDMVNDEIRKILTFFRGRFRNIEISRGYIFGNGSELKGFSEFWDLNLNLTIEQLHSIKGKNSQDINVNPAHINAISALIRN